MFHVFVIFSSFLNVYMVCIYLNFSFSYTKLNLEVKT